MTDWSVAALIYISLPSLGAVWTDASSAAAVQGLAWDLKLNPRRLSVQPTAAGEGGGIPSSSSSPLLRSARDEPTGGGGRRLLCCGESVSVTADASGGQARRGTTKRALLAGAQGDGGGVALTVSLSGFGADLQAAEAAAASLATAIASPASALAAVLREPGAVGEGAKSSCGPHLLAPPGSCLNACLPACCFSLLASSRLRARQRHISDHMRILNLRAISWSMRRAACRCRPCHSFPGRPARHRGKGRRSHRCDIRRRSKIARRSHQTDNRGEDLHSLLPVRTMWCNSWTHLVPVTESQVSQA